MGLSVGLNLMFRAGVKPTPDCGCRSVRDRTGLYRRRACHATVIGAALLAFAANSASLSELPNGPNRELVSKVCQSCHDLQMVLDAAGISREEWNMSLDEMAANGMNISADERAKIIDYLSTFLGPSPPPAASQIYPD